MWILHCLLFALVPRLRLGTHCLAGVVALACLIGLVMCMIKAFQGQYFKLPVLGPFAEKFSQK